MELRQIGLARVVDQGELVAWKRAAARAGADVVRPVGEEDVEVLGRADAVEDLDAGLRPVDRAHRQERLLVEQAGSNQRPARRAAHVNPAIALRYE